LAGQSGLILTAAKIPELSKERTNWFIGREAAAFDDKFKALTISAMEIKAAPRQDQDPDAARYPWRSQVTTKAWNLGIVCKGMHQRENP
jgi:hypothetical protein